MTNEEYNAEIERIEKRVKDALPQFGATVESGLSKVIFHQDAFAADLQPDEFMLLGMAIKVLGHYGKEVTIIGTNRETLK